MRSYQCQNERLHFSTQPRVISHFMSNLPLFTSFHFHSCNIAKPMVYHLWLDHQVKYIDCICNVVSSSALYSHFGPINPSWHIQEPDNGSQVPSLSQSQKYSQLGPKRPLLHVFLQSGPVDPDGQIQFPVIWSHSASPQSHVSLQWRPNVPLLHCVSHWSPIKPRGHLHWPVMALHFPPLTQSHSSEQYGPWLPTGHSSSQLWP